MMVFCIKNNGENKTRVKRKNKTSRKTNKTNVKTQQNQLGAVLDVSTPCFKEKMDVFPRQKCQSD